MQSTLHALDSVSKKILALLPPLNQQEASISVQLYRLLAEGRPVSRDELAEAAEVAPDTVEEVLDAWPGVYTDDDQKIIGYWGLALSEMPHRFKVEGTQLYTWCAWDTLFIPEILQKTAMVESPCPVTKEIIRLTVSPREIENAEPNEIVVSLLLPDPNDFENNVISSFCHHIHFFRSEMEGTEWVNKYPGLFLVSLADAFRLGRMKNEMQYREVLKSVVRS